MSLTPSHKNILDNKKLDARNFLFKNDYLSKSKSADIFNKEVNTSKINKSKVDDYDLISKKNINNCSLTDLDLEIENDSKELENNTISNTNSKLINNDLNKHKTMGLGFDEVSKNKNSNSNIKEKNANNNLKNRNMTEENLVKHDLDRSNISANILKSSNNFNLSYYLSNTNYYDTFKCKNNPLDNYNENFKNMYYKSYLKRSKNNKDNSFTHSNNKKPLSTRNAVSNRKVDFTARFNKKSENLNIMEDISISNSFTNKLLKNQEKSIKNNEKRNNSNNLNHSIKDTKPNDFEYHFNQKLKVLEEEIRRKMNENQTASNKRHIINNLKPIVEAELKKELYSEVRERIKTEIELQSFKDFNNKKLLEMDKIKRRMEQIYKEKTTAHYNKLKESIDKQLQEEYLNKLKLKEKEISENFQNQLKEYKEIKKTKIIEQINQKNQQLFNEHERLKQELQEAKQRELEILKQIDQEHKELVLKAEKQKNNLYELERVLEASKDGLKCSKTTSSLIKLKLEMNKNENKSENKNNKQTQQNKFVYRKENSKIISNNNTLLQNTINNNTNFYENESLENESKKLALNEVIGLPDYYNNENYDEDINYPNLNENNSHISSNKEQVYSLNLFNDCKSLEVLNMNLPVKFEYYKEFLTEFLKNESYKREIYETIKLQLLNVYENRYNENDNNKNSKNPLVLLKYLIEVWKKLDISFDRRFEVLNYLYKISFSEAEIFLDKETELLTKYYHNCIGTINLIRKKERFKLETPNKSKGKKLY